MIRLAGRDEVLACNPFYAGSLMELQALWFDPDDQANGWDRPGDDATAEELEEWRELYDAQRQAYERARDRVELPPDLDTGCEETLILATDITDINIFPPLFGLRCGRLMEEMGWEELFFLPLPRGVSWHTTRDDFEPLVAANEALRALGIDQEYQGGIIADPASVGEIVAPLFWPVRCDTDYPLIYFSCASAPFLGSICKYGNLHIHAGTAAYAAQLREAALRSGWTTPGSCYEPFSEDGSIEGRRLILE